MITLNTYFGLISFPVGMELFNHRGCREHRKRAIIPT
jgi:hypothetical protein